MAWREDAGNQATGGGADDGGDHWQEPDASDLVERLHMTGKLDERKTDAYSQRKRRIKPPERPDKVDKASRVPGGGSGHGAHGNDSSQAHW